ncbi:unnamed protein product, partial [Meganyctiphanes norvegica]
MSEQSRLCPNGALCPWALPYPQVKHEASCKQHQPSRGAEGPLAYLVVNTFDIWYIHVVVRWADIFIFLACKKIHANHVNLGVTMLASDVDISTILQGRA